MSKRQLGKVLLLVLGSVVCFGFGAAAFAVTSGIGAVASTVTGGLANVAKLITAAAYVAGFGFAVGGIVKFKAHKDNPTQVPISQPIVLVFVGAALIFAPSVFQTVGYTLFSSGGQTATVAGTTGGRFTSFS